MVQATTQRTILCTWLTEILLDEMNSLQDLDDVQLQTQLASSLATEFRTFLTEHLSSLNEATTFHLISSHGRVPELLFYAGLVKDYERVLTHYMQLGKWDTALETLREVRSCRHVLAVLWRLTHTCLLTAGDDRLLGIKPRSCTTSSRHA